MLKPKVLPEILAQCNSGGVKTTMLFNRDGSLLATVGEDSSAEKTTAARGAMTRSRRSVRERDSRLRALLSDSVSAVMANIWASFAKAGEAHVVLLDCERGRVGVTLVAEKLLLCLYGEPSTPFGQLKLKAETLAKYLDAPLSQILGGGGAGDAGDGAGVGGGAAGGGGAGAGAAGASSSAAAAGAGGN